ncbi:MAG TPA: hypothetical protein PLP88_03785 [Bacteroidales bacterium]|nr:hypothetical protein [Bacteroidales bacterium]
MAKKLLYLIVISFILIQCSYKDDKYKVGQVWNYKTRQNEVNSSLTIVSINNDKKEGVIIGVHLSNIKFSRIGNFDEVNINFLPFSKSALDKSLTTIKEYTEELPDFKTEYDSWKHTDDTSINKCFRSSVIQVLDSIEIKVGKL